MKRSMDRVVPGEASVHLILHLLSSVDFNNTGATVCWKSRVNDREREVNNSNVVTVNCQTQAASVPVMAIGQL